MHDIRYACRSLRATPVVSVVAVLSLALAIGANTAIFSILDSLLLRSLPVRDPQRLAMLDQGPWSNLVWEQIRDRPGLADGAFAWASTRFDLANGGQTEFVNGVWTSGRFFDVLGVRAILGRTFTADDDRRGGGRDGPAAVVSYDFWQRRYGGSAAVVGQSLTVDGCSLTIVGVAPPGFYGPEVGLSFDVAVPLGAEPVLRGRDSTLDRRSTTWLSIMLRTKAGQTIGSATSALRGVQRQIRQATLPPDWPAPFIHDYLRAPFTLVPASTGASSLRLRYQRPLLTIMVVVTLVLLVACANIANLLLARAAARRQELGVRLALGASRFRLARLLLTESLLISLAGAALGLLFARWASRLLVAQLATHSDRVSLDLSLDWRVLGFTAVAGIATTLLFGIVPSLRAAGVRPTEALARQDRGVVVSGCTRFGNALVVAQVALSLMLVVAGGLFVRTFVALTAVKLGFDRDPVLVAFVNARQSDVKREDLLARYEEMKQAVESAPGVARTALSEVTPVSRNNWQYLVDVSGAVALSMGQRRVFVNIVSPGWFATYGTRLLAGRDFADSDSAAAGRVAVVNQAFARHFLNGASPLGRTVRRAVVPPGRPNPPLHIVGVVSDAVYRSLREPPTPTMYVPLAQFDTVPPALSLSVRSAGPAPALLARDIAAAVARIDRRFALTFRPLKDYVDASLAQERLVAILAGFFGGLALVLAALGLFGVTSYRVSRQRAGIGIRMALGASRAAVVRNQLVRVAWLVGAGVIAGGVASLWAGQFVRTLLFGLEPRDPWTFATAAVVLGAAAMLAAWLPARRAARIDPADALRW